MEKAVEGLLFDLSPYTAGTYSNPNDAIQYGRAVARIPENENGIKPPDASDSSILGVSVKATPTENATYPAKSAVSVLRKGRIWVKVEEDVSPDDPVYVKYVGDLGTFRKSDPGSEALQLQDAAWLTKADAGELAVLELNLP